MCGILGFYDHNKNSHDKIKLISSMMETISHRGPDSNGYWLDDKSDLVLGHVRLSIIDLTSNASQPMMKGSGRYIISYNGEIYNFLNLRKEIQDQGIKFSSSSDTEVLLQGIELWGLDKTLEKIEGMYAIALWDKKDKKLYLIRDRMGEKPLFYGFSNGKFFFSSELHPLYNSNYFPLELCHKSINTFLHFGYNDKDTTIFKNIFSVPKGAYLSVTFDKSLNKKICHEIKTYWKIKNKKTSYLNSDEASYKLELLIKDKIRDQMVSDVPIGAFLSGGIDSSIIVSMMQELSTKKINTFTIGFQEKSFNEAMYAKEIANYIGTDHHELYINNDQLLKTVKNITDVYDQPFGDISSIPTKILSDFTRKHVTVSLSGDAGDELFFGYDRYKIFNQFYNLPFKEILSKFIGYIPKNKIERIFKIFDHYSFEYINASRIAKFEKLLSNSTGTVLDYHTMLSCDSNKVSEIHKNYEDLENYLDLKRNFSSNSKNNKNFIDDLIHEDLERYLPQNILVKVDRAAMSSSLETRIPFLNHKIVEFANSLPIEFKYNNRDGMKSILKDIAYRRIPKKNLKRSKQGFSVPIGKWLRGPLKNWMHEILNENDIKKTNVLSSDGIKNLLEDFEKKENFQHAQLIWNTINLQKWLVQNNLCL